MKTVFIVNPKSGSGKKLHAIIDEIENLRKKAENDIDVYFTKFSSDARNYVRDY